jgi:nitrate/nitrite transporter NarK
MADDDIERGAGTHTDTSSESSESLEEYSERVSLLPSGYDSRSSSSKTYKSTEITTSAESVEESGTENVEQPNSRSVISILSLLLVGVFISSADGTLVMATYTTISSEFKAFGDAAWLTTCYVLASCALQPLVGKLSDIYGRKPVLLISYAVFAVGSVLTGASQTMWQAVVARIVSGISSAGMVVIVSVLITGEFYSPEYRGGKG